MNNIIKSNDTSNANIIVGQLLLIKKSDWQRWFNKKNEQTQLNKKKYLPNFQIYYKSLLKYILKDEIVNHSERFKCHETIFEAKLLSGNISIHRVRGFSTLYYNYMDSFFTNGDIAWGIDDNNQHFQHKIDTIWKIQFDSLTYMKDFINNDIIVSFGSPVVDTVNNISVNMETFNSESTKFQILPNIYHVTNVKNFIQKLYVSHDHNCMTKNDHQILNNQITDKWPYIDTNWIPDHRIFNQKYCGFYFTNTIKTDCCIHENPILKLYSVYQGFIPRLFSTRRISDLI